MPHVVRIEAPVSKVIESLVTPIRGWISSDVEPSSVTITLGGQEVRSNLIDRPDVRRAFPGKSAAGFVSKIDFRTVSNFDKIEDVVLLVDGKEFARLPVRVDKIASFRDSWANTKKKKLAWANDHLACSVCGKSITFTSTEIDCKTCGSHFTMGSNSIDLLPQSLRDEFRIIDTENVSAHPYAPEAMKFFSEVSADRGMILDMGSGDQAYIDPSIICSEIVAYPATDVLAVGQRLPFQDASFDGVHSNAVLEHVTDPFACAAEIMRVLKPGGRIFCSVPFLQPEHGYPHHYYNMTQDGLTNLFTRLGANVLEKATPNWGHPMYTGQWFMSSYLKYLSPDQRTKLEAMSISDFLKLRRSPVEPMFSSLSDEGLRVLACATYATFSKPC
ncbi:hypothetical protein ASD99_12025 [Mesorhizobium sp. Root695]|uniref:methyltransferase domain-containing protein n=1 Tax=Mesorhizobium sp. Root695 TaxID=1736589 RepID=UPI00070CB531|nr:class I SAM-dependent methyltransferase [Mesorhizobium sp. Root695]KRB14947.1 hypothetical protein ASD99_12025 [Mesorhizobium sp. Root695]